MGIGKKRVARNVILAVMVAALLMTTFAVMGLAQEDSSSWVWTEKFPKPSWWTWGADYEPSKPARGGYYRTSASRYIGLMNPNHWPVNDWVAMTQMYEMLIYNGGEFRAAMPWLCSSFEFTSPTTVVMKLRQGVTFHDGAKFNAAAVKYQMDWIRDRKSGAWSRAWLKPVTSIEVLDEYTVKWTFKKPWAAFPGIMANVPGYCISPKALKADVDRNELKKLTSKIAKAKKEADQNKEASNQLAKMEAQAKKLEENIKGTLPLDSWAVGTGVNMVEDANPGNYLKLKRNPNWWFGKSIGRPEMPYFDGWLITVIPDPSVVLANVRAGKLDSMSVDPSQLSIVLKDPNLKSRKVEGNHLVAMRFNTTQGPCKDIRVRKAISHAIDRKALIIGTQQGLGIEASGMYNSGHWCHNPNLKPVTYDPELAKKLLAEAGYPNGLTVKGYYSNAPSAMTVAEAVKDMLKKVGVQWQVDFIDSVAMSDRMKNVEYDFAGGGWSWIWDPDLMATGLYMPEGGFNFGRSDNKKAQELIIKGREEVDVAKRQKIYWELEKTIYDSYEDAFLWYPLSVTAYRQNVMGWNTELYLKGREGFWFSHPMWFKDGQP